MERSIAEIERHVISDVEKRFGIQITAIQPINRGFRNLKWLVGTDRGPLFIKQYNKKRYPARQVPNLIKSLELHRSLYQSGVPTPALLDVNGELLQRTDCGERYIVMKHLHGNLIQAGGATEDQLYALGQSVGKMHHTLALKPKKRLTWKPVSKEQMWISWNERWKDAYQKDDFAVAEALLAQRPIIEEMDLNSFQKAKRGWTHWDLFVDNVLFSGERVSAILDFDRMRFAYEELDVARALLSTSLNDGKITIEPFVTGYREWNELSGEAIIRSFHMTWWNEADWITADSEKTAPMQRFNEEHRWLSRGGLEELREQVASL